ncbi:hypothetical protein ONZ51_g7330 [Trametes cubensis]|uniref:Uncharacterized protein n=1 Tax=Trametes cubensis TaxID=1111947 RepID=A0AAD7TSW5_9APHY|nr:hypothetical protein ONZ51_g7330 [Trametes cubensis]
MPFQMDAKALSTLPSPALRNFAERVGIEANKRKKDVIRDLVDKYHPMLVPYEPDSVTNSPTSASSEVARRQGAVEESQGQGVSASAICSSNLPGRGIGSPIAQKVAPVHKSCKGLWIQSRLSHRERGEAHEQLRELQLLLSSIGRRTAMLVERGSGSRDSAPRVEKNEKIEATYEEEEEELLEVEEMTSREVDLSDLPSTPHGDGETAGRGQKRKRVVEDASPHDSLRKRTRVEPCLGARQ